MSRTAKSPTVTRNPARRSALIALVAGLAGANAWNASTTTWFTGAFSNQSGAPTLVGVTLDGMTRNAMVDSPTGGVAASYTILGMPGPRAWLLVALGLAVVAVLLRMGLFAMMSLGALWAARSAAVAAEHTLMSVAADGRFTHNGTGFVNFLDWIWITGALIGVLAAQITYSNSVARRQRERSGEETEPGVLDILENIGQSVTNRYARTNTRSEAAKDAETRQHAPA